MSFKDWLDRLTHKLIHESIGEAGAVPVGGIIATATLTAPRGYLLCDGSLVSRTQYSALFTAIGGQYGAGDGSTTFALPNLKGRVIMMHDAAQTEFDTVGETGGSKTSTAPHTHSLSAHTHATQTHTHTFGTNTVSTTHAHNVYARNQDTGTVSSWHRHPINHWHFANWSNLHWNGTQTHGHHGRGGIGSEAPWEGANWGSNVPVNVDGQANDAPGGHNWSGDPNANHVHNFNHDHPSTNYQHESGWPGNHQHSHSGTTDGMGNLGAQQGPSNDTSGASSAGAASGNLVPYLVMNYCIKA